MTVSRGKAPAGCAPPRLLLRPLPPLKGSPARQPCGVPLSLEWLPLQRKIQGKFEGELALQLLLSYKVL